MAQDEDARLVFSSRKEVIHSRLERDDNDGNDRFGTGAFSKKEFLSRSVNMVESGFMSDVSARQCENGDDK
jgi:hypothetical protein